MNMDTSWGKVADWYDDLLEGSDDSFQKRVILPNLLRILDPKKGMAVLDVAGGQGFFSRAFASKGASVTSCDISEELIALAKKKAEELAQGSKMEGELDHQVSASHEFISKLGLGGSYFDAATIVLAIQNIEKYAETFEECAKALKQNGRLIIVINHPAFRIPGSTSWQWDREAGQQYRRVDAYMSESRQKIDMTPGEKDASKKRFTVSFHRPLQAYAKALAKQGFAISRMEEWISHRASEKGPRQKEEDRLRKEIPMFLCIEAVKL